MKTNKLLLIFTLLAVHAFGQEDESPDFLYEPLQDIKKTSFVSVGLEPLQVGVQGYYLTLAAGLDLRLSNLGEKISAEAHVGYNYVNYSFDGNPRRYQSLAFDDQKAFNIEALFGYTLVQKKEMEDMYVRLKKVGNTETVSDLPCRVITSYIVRGGYYSYDFFMSGEPNLDVAGSGRYEVFEKTQNILLGAVRKKSVDSKFKTDKYGTIKQTFDSEIFFDLIINIGSEIPDILELEYLNTTYPQQVTGKKTVSAADQDLFRSDFFKIPLGFRLGWRSQPFNTWGFYYGIDAGVYPGSYSSFITLTPVVATMSLGFRFMNKIK